MKLRDGVSIPITWVFAAYVPTTGFVIASLWWVFTVDSRLERIEHHLGISAPVANINIMTDAKAGQ